MSAPRRLNAGAPHWGALAYPAVVALSALCIGVSVLLGKLRKQQQDDAPEAGNAPEAESIFRSLTERRDG